MAFTPVQRMQIGNGVERVLHVPGNYNGGILEMAVVFDGNLTSEVIRQRGKDIAGLLKSHSEVFRNVRVNGIYWKEDGVFISEVTSLPKLQMGRCFEGVLEKEQRVSDIGMSKRLELLTAQLKKFYARSKLILLFTDGNYRIGDEAVYRESLHPFLHRKVLVLQGDEAPGQLMPDIRTEASEK